MKHKTFEICDACSREDIPKQSPLSIPFNWQACSNCGAVNALTQPVEIQATPHFNDGYRQWWLVNKVVIAS